MVAQVYFWTNMDNVISFIATNCYVNMTFQRPSSRLWLLNELYIKSNRPSNCLLHCRVPSLHCHIFPRAVTTRRLQLLLKDTDSLSLNIHQIKLFIVLIIKLSDIRTHENRVSFIITQG